MTISPAFRRTYPGLSTWITRNLPRVRHKARVWRAFIRFSQLQPASALRAISPGKSPVIHYRIMPGSNGQFRGSTNPNKVYLAKSICDRFEASDSDNPNMHLLIESTLLHEMVHWGDWKDGEDQAGEEGVNFELAAYGRNVGRYW